LRRFAALQAWYEHMPVRRAQFPAGGALTMYRRLDFGSLLRMHVLDTRQYRTDQLCDANAAELIGAVLARVEHVHAQQEAWLGNGLDDRASWHLLAQQVMVMPFAYPEVRAAGRINQDSWSGYPIARERLIRQIRERKLRNVVIATGDVHKHHAGVGPADARDLESPAVATEFVCTSISSDGDGTDLPKGWERAPAENPHCPLINARRGFQIFDMSADQLRTDVWTVDKVTSPGGRLTKLASLTVEPERPGLNE
jgi:alkaline phosphatase D